MRNERPFAHVVAMWVLRGPWWGAVHYGFPPGIFYSGERCCRVTGGYIGDGCFRTISGCAGCFRAGFGHMPRFRAGFGHSLRLRATFCRFGLLERTKAARKRMRCPDSARERSCNGSSARISPENAAANSKLPSGGSYRMLIGRFWPAARICRLGNGPGRRSVADYPSSLSSSAPSASASARTARLGRLFPCDMCMATSCSVCGPISEWAASAA